MKGELRLISPMNRDSQPAQGRGSCFFFTIKVVALNDSRDDESGTDGKHREFFVIDERPSECALPHDIIAHLLDDLAYLVETWEI